MIPLAAPSRPPMTAPVIALWLARFCAIHSLMFFGFVFGPAFGGAVVAHADARSVRTRMDAMRTLMSKLLRRQFLGGDEGFRIVLFVGPTVVSLKVLFQPSFARASSVRARSAT